MTRRVDVARAALYDIGRPDLAILVRENSIGDPTVPGDLTRPKADSVLILRAFRLGHQSDPDGAPVVCHPPSSLPRAFVACDHCWGNCP